MHQRIAKSVVEQRVRLILVMACVIVSSVLTSGVAETYSLSDALAVQGAVVINGVGAGDNSGYCLSGAGDVNGDGLDDQIIGAPHADPGGRFDAGVSYIVFGTSSKAPIELSDVAMGVGGFSINGITAGDESGFSVSNGGDINGDGLSDVIVGAHNVAQSSGAAAGETYVVFGRLDTAPVELSNVAAGIRGFAIKGVNMGDQSGFSVSTAGDVNADGLDDIVIGAPYSNSAGYRMTYVVFGKSSTDAVELSDVENEIGGFVIFSAVGPDPTGFSVSDAGDVNGDGIGDVIVGQPAAFTGKAYVVYGNLTGQNVDLADVEQQPGIGGFEIVQNSPGGSQIGYIVRNAGDINGDGLDDVMIGAPDTAANPYAAILFGKPDSNRADLFQLFSSGMGVGLIIPNTPYGVGSSMCGLTDVTKDGLNEFVIGSPASEVDGKAAAGQIAIFEGIGGSGGFTRQFQTSEYLLLGIDAGDQAGFSLSDAGDMNGDGWSDIMIGAPGGDPGGNADAGESYIVFAITEGAAPPHVCPFQVILDAEWSVMAGQYSYEDDVVIVPGHVIPERWLVALIEQVLCDASLTPQHAITLQAYIDNLEQLENESQMVIDTVGEFKHVLATLLLLDQDRQDHFVAQFGLANSYVIAGSGARSVNDLFADDGDLDQDGFSNQEEYFNVVDRNGTFVDFAEAASSSVRSGSLPVDNAVTLALSAIAMAWIGYRNLYRNRVEAPGT